MKIFKKEKIRILKWKVEHIQLGVRGGNDLTDKLIQLRGVQKMKCNHHISEKYKKKFLAKFFKINRINVSGSWDDKVNLFGAQDACYVFFKIA